VRNIGLEKTNQGLLIEMCNKRNTVMAVLSAKGVGAKKIRCDVCIRDFLQTLNLYGIETVGSCCGHGRYPLTVIWKRVDGKYFELISGVNIPRTRNFYRTDKDGFYYIPELSEKKP